MYCFLSLAIRTDATNQHFHIRTFSVNTSNLVTSFCEWNNADHREGAWVVQGDKTRPFVEPGPIPPSLSIQLLCSSSEQSDGPQPVTSITSVTAPSGPIMVTSSGLVPASVCLSRRLPFSSPFTPVQGIPSQIQVSSSHFSASNPSVDPRGTRD